MDEALVATVVIVATSVIGTLLPVPSAGGRRMDAGYVPIAVLPFLAPNLDMPASAVVGVIAVVLVLRALVWAIRGVHSTAASRRLIREGAGFVTWVLVYGTIREIADGTLTAQLVAPLIAAASWFAVDVAMGVAMALPPRRPARVFAARLGLADVDIFLTLVATGALVGITLPELGAWALVIAGLPYAFAHTSFWRLDATRQTYRQTIRALARIPEVSGLGVAGHSERTAQLAIETAKALGMTPRQVEEVEYAAIMHDLGRITLNEPAVVRRGYTEQDIAGWGAEIIGETAYLERVADVVRRQHEPYRAPGQSPDPEVPLAARVVRAASVFDHGVSGHGLSTLEALERLHRGSAYDYDPEVVAALRRVVGE